MQFSLTTIILALIATSVADDYGDCCFNCEQACVANSNPQACTSGTGFDTIAKYCTNLCGLNGKCQ
ncbi:hypothetical protein HYALB_00002874 [Hymenoscyphus albidus]|uniref:Extracellular membrane protein CFEM domain-containing protein n=1 Tax=Hymenoscyphus albidus TaxID=595503 RepID=A0A9N9LGY3_9HELO|nr:hypothetical protein HYALB_00002874 [Hymenoscyphus albidus]